MRIEIDDLQNTIRSAIGTMLSRSGRAAAPSFLSSLLHAARSAAPPPPIRPTHVAAPASSRAGLFDPSVLCINGVFGRYMTTQLDVEVGTQTSNASSSSSSSSVDDDDESDDGESDDDGNGCDDVEDGHKLKSDGVVNEELEKSVELVMAILRGFGSDNVRARCDLDGCGVRASPELVEEVLSRTRNDWAAAFTFFLWAQKKPGYSHSLRDYHTMIAILGKMKRFDTAWSVIDEMRRSPGRPTVTPGTLLILVRKYAAAHDVANAIGTFYSYKRFGFEIGLEEFHDLLSALCRYKNVQDAEHLLLCNENVFSLDVKSFNIVLNGWCNLVVSVREAKRFWNEMGRRGVCRDAVSYGSMMSCYSKAGSLRDVLKLFDQMKEQSIVPDRKVYNAVVFALAKGKCAKEAIGLMKTMEENGCAPNSVTYNSMIKPLCKARKLEEAKSLFDEMLQSGFSPSIRTFHAFFSVAKTVEEVLELLDKMAKTVCHPATDTYIMLIRKFCRWKQYENAYRIWNEMGAKGPSPDRSAYIVFIHGLFLNGRLEEAYKFYEEMKVKGFAPEPKTEEMLGAWAAAKEISKTQMAELVNRCVDLDSDKKSRQGRTFSQSDHFLKKAEIRNVTRERGFSLW